MSRIPACVTGSSRRHGCCRGMTLLELLVALSLFALLSAMAWGGLRAVIDADQATRDETRELVQLQRALSRLGEDLQQLVARPVRGGYGETLPALDANGRGRLEWTRGGGIQLPDSERATLRRLAWVWQGDTLMRDTWQVLDRAQDSQAQREILLEGVEGLSLRLLDDQQRWQSVWPPDNSPDALVRLPRAIEVELRTRRWGSIRRLWRLPRPQRS